MFCEYNFLKEKNTRTLTQGKYCIKTYVEIEQVDNNPENTGITLEVKYYNKFMYFCLVGGEITSSIGNSFTSWLKNKSSDL